MGNLLSRVGWSILEYLRRGVTPFVLNLMFGMTIFAFSGIETAELKFILVFAFLALTYFVDFILIRSMGEYAYKMKVAGDNIRNGRPAGMDLGNGAKYRPSKEYRVYKGFIIGLVVCIVPIVFIIADLCTGSTGARVAFGMVAGWAVMPVLNISSQASLLYALIPCGVEIVAAGIAYILGGNKERDRQLALEQKAETVSKVKGAKKR